jgi:hypothetical protein
MKLVRDGVSKGFHGVTGTDQRYAAADREYAQGLLAGTVAESIEHFRRAVELGRF